MTTVVFHNADYDGIFCREIARKFLPDSELIGWNFGDKRIPIPTEGTVYILDLPPDCLEDGELGNGRVIWIDHHKTSIEKWGNSLPGYRMDGVAACRLTWQWFLSRQDPGPHSPLPHKDQFLKRMICEPLSVRLVGEYDVWDKRDLRTDTFQYGLRTVNGETEMVPRLTWIEALLGSDDLAASCAFDGIMEAGKHGQAYARYIDTEKMREAAFLLEWEGLRFLALNDPGRGSLRFDSQDNTERGHDALLSFGWARDHWTVSLYHAKHRTDLDLSEIAKKYGGGGHKGACGFTCKALPFMKAHEAVQKGDAT